MEKSEPRELIYQERVIFASQKTALENKCSFLFSSHGQQSCWRLLQKRMLFVILCSSLFALWFSFWFWFWFAEPETKIVERSLFMLLYWKNKIPGMNAHCSSSFKKYSAQVSQPWAEAWPVQVTFSKKQLLVFCWGSSKAWLKQSFRRLSRCM